MAQKACDRFYTIIGPGGYDLASKMVRLMKAQPGTEPRLKTPVLSNNRLSKCQKRTSTTVKGSPGNKLPNLSVRCSILSYYPANLISGNLEGSAFSMMNFSRSWVPWLTTRNCGRDARSA